MFLLSSTFRLILVETGKGVGVTERAQAVIIYSEVDIIKLYI